MFTEFDISPIIHIYKQIVSRGAAVWCRLWMCVYLLNLDLYFTILMKYVFLHYSVIYQTMTKYYQNL